MTKRIHSTKVSIVAGMLSLILCSPTLYGQQPALNQLKIEVSKKPLHKVLELLAKQYGYTFFYNQSTLQGIQVSASIKEGSLEQVMNALLEGTGLHYSLHHNAVTLTKAVANSPQPALLGGKVTDKEGLGLPGVIIRTEDGKIVTATDIEGRYAFEHPIPNGTVLYYTYIGMKSFRHVYEGTKSLIVTLEEDVAVLQDVIVTGFQTISRERSTGAANIIKREDLERVQAPDLSSKIEGLAPGLTNYNGSMSIRGVSSFAINSTPLIVLDGQPVIGLTINEINPSDIESVTVLKDAAATSLYGVRASNGVIVVTTKRAEGSNTNITVSSNFYVNPLPSLDYNQYASTSDIIDYETEYLINNPSYLSNPLTYFENLNRVESPSTISQVGMLYYQLAQGQVSQGNLSHMLNALRSNDYRKAYQKEVQQMKVNQDYNLSLSKASDKSSLFFSARYEHEGSYNKHEGGDKLSLYLKNDLAITKWFDLTLGANVNLSKAENNMASYQGATTFMPYDRLYNDDGSYAYSYPYNYYRAQEIGATSGLYGMGYNAIEESRRNIETTHDNYWKLFTQASFKILEGLNLGVKFQYEDRNRNKEQYDEVNSYTMRHLINAFASNGLYGNYIYHIPNGGHMLESQTKWNYLNLRVQADYQKSFVEKHDLVALIGGEVREDNYRFSAGERYGYDENRLTYQQVDWLTLSQTGVVGQLNSNNRTLGQVLAISKTKHRYLSAYFNGGYIYDTRYAFNASVRVEQADLFGSDPKYRYRPLWSLGGSWNVTNEEFMKECTWLNTLKYRMTYGITGNVDQSSSPYLLGSYLNSPYSGGNMTDISSPPNKTLRWEKTSTWNFGLDFIVLDKLRGSVDYYNRYSSDLLANKSLDPSLGFETARMNNGAMRNQGVELNFSYDWSLNKDWALGATFTTAYNHNKIDEVGYIPVDALEMMRYPNSNYLKGDAYNSLYAYRYAGLTATGDPSIYTADGEIISNIALRDINALVCVGQLTPKWNGALDLNLRWRDFSFFTKIVYYTGHSMRVDATPLYAGVTSGNVHKDIVNRWTQNNTNTDIPSMNVYGYTQDRNNHWIYADYNTTSASFAKMRNVGLAYSLPKKMLTKAGFNHITLRAQINNPLTWVANNRDIDPEAFNANTGVRGQALATSYIFGLNINL